MPVPIEQQHYLVATRQQVLDLARDPFPTHTQRVINIHRALETFWGHAQAWREKRMAKIFFWIGFGSGAVAMGILGTVLILTKK